MFKQISGTHCGFVTIPFLHASALCQQCHQGVSDANQQIAGNQRFHVLFVRARARVGVEQQAHPGICQLPLRQWLPFRVPLLESGKSGFSMGWFGMDINQAQ